MLADRSKKSEKDVDIVTRVSQCCVKASLKRVKQPFSERSLALSPLRSDTRGEQGAAERFPFGVNGTINQAARRGAPKPSERMRGINQRRELC